MMLDTRYVERRDRLADYFDRHALEAWTRLTSDAPLGRVRAAVRAGRDDMRSVLLDMLPPDLSGRRVLDAGCGPGQLSIELARRGADVVASDLSPRLVALAAERMPADLAGRVRFTAGDMLDASLGRFDHVVLMDSVIHYAAPDLGRAIATLAERTARSLVFTFVPGSPLLALRLAVGHLFPRADRAPDVVPISPKRIEALLRGRGLSAGRHHRVSSGFYVSDAQEVLVG